MKKYLSLLLGAVMVMSAQSVVLAGEPAIESESAAISEQTASLKKSTDMLTLLASDSPADKALDMQERIDNNNKILNAAAKTQEALALLDKQIFADGCVAAEDAIKLNPDYAPAYNCRGLAYAYLENYEAALADYNKAIELDPKYANAYINRGTLYALVQNYPASEDDLNKAVSLNSKNANAYFTLGRLYEQGGKYMKAVSSLDKAIELDSKNIQYLFLRAQCLRESGQYADSLKDLYDLVDMQPGNEAIKNYLEEVKALDPDAAAFIEKGRELKHKKKK